MFFPELINAKELYIVHSIGIEHLIISEEVKSYSIGINKPWSGNSYSEQYTIMFNANNGRIGLADVSYGNLYGDEYRHAIHSVYYK